MSTSEQTVQPTEQPVATTALAELDPDPTRFINKGNLKPNDPRINRLGPSIKLRTFRNKLRDLLIDEGLREVDGLQTGPVKNMDAENQEKVTRMQRVVERIFDEAEAGEAWACQLIFDRVDGKVAVSPPEDDSKDKHLVLVIKGASVEEL